MYQAALCFFSDFFLSCINQKIILRSSLWLAIRIPLCWSYLYINLCVSACVCWTEELNKWNPSPWMSFEKNYNVLRRILLLLPVRYVEPNNGKNNGVLSLNVKHTCVWSCCGLYQWFHFYFCAVVQLLLILISMGRNEKKENPFFFSFLC